MEYQRIWLLVLFCLSSWDMHAQHFVIEGKTNGYVPDGSILYLGRWNGMGAMIYFTSDMIRNGTFRLEGKREKTPDIIYLYGTEKAIGTLNLRLWVGDDTIRVSANSEVPETWIVENNMPQQAEEDFYRQLKGKDNIIKTSRMNSRQLWDRSLTPDSVRILTNHPKHLCMGREIYGQLTGKQKQTYYGKFAKSYFYPDKTPEKGDYYIDANLFDLKGDSCKLTDYLNKGKYILLDFWDLYCAPCKKSVPGLKELFSSCADKLTIISINVGSRESQVKGSSDFLWENLSDGQGLTGIASRYGIKSIPCFILIAPNGRIEKYWKGYAMQHSGMEKEIMEIILPNSSPTETSK